MLGDMHLEHTRTKPTSIKVKSTFYTTRNLTLDALRFKTFRVPCPFGWDATGRSFPLFQQQVLVSRASDLPAERSLSPRRRALELQPELAHRRQPFRSAQRVPVLMSVSILNGSGSPTYGAAIVPPHIKRDGHCGAVFNPRDKLTFVNLKLNFLAKIMSKREK